MTNQATVTSASGTYTANLLGNIRSHLAGLQGYDVMALELIQNADDAKADSIIFDVTDDGLLVWNSGTFTYCGDLNTNPCRDLISSNFGCDYHRIADVGSGGKLAKGENIGRFGIGFVSTYQVTDHPEIRSAGLKLSLYPEEGRWRISPFEEGNGTSFFLPWANDPNSDGRRQLGISHVTADHIERLIEEFRATIRDSLLFLRHVKKAVLLRNGELIASCQLDRDEDSTLIATFQPSGEAEQWHIIRADASKDAEFLYSKHPQLKTLSRSTKVTIALRVEPAPLVSGKLYAYLPTEQSTGLPIHINADFFPEPDRKAIIFAGYQHAQAWNEMLVEAAADALAASPAVLLQTLGQQAFWRTVDCAYALANNLEDYPACFSLFWKKLKTACADSAVALAGDGSLRAPKGLLLPRFSPDQYQVGALQKIGGMVVSEEIRSYHTVLGQLGASVLTLDRFIALFTSATPLAANHGKRIDEPTILNLYVPLCEIANELLPDSYPVRSPTGSSVSLLSSCIFVVTEDFHVVSPRRAWRVPDEQDSRSVARLLPLLAISSKKLASMPRLAKLMQSLDLAGVANHLKESFAQRYSAERIIATDEGGLRALYGLLADLDRLGHFDESTYRSLRDVPIWLSRKGLISASSALLPGDFSDPTGHAGTLCANVMSATVRTFLTQKLKVPVQNIESFVCTTVPSLFNQDGPIDASFHKPLITELANHPRLLDQEDIRSLLSALPIVPTEDGGWSAPAKTYRRSDDLVKVLGDVAHLWLDSHRLPGTRSVRAFVENLGINRIPRPCHLADRLRKLAAQNKPTDEIKRASAEAFYALCEIHAQSRSSPSYVEAISELKSSACFPAIGDSDTWHSPGEMHAPYRAEAFESQAYVLDFRSTARLNPEVLRELGFAMEPRTQQVVNHLRHCVTANKPAPDTTYQLLNERCNTDAESISTLRGEPFIYVESAERYVVANRLFWSPQQLGHYAFSIPSKYDRFKPLLTAVGAKASPDTRDLAEILIDIVGRHFERGTAVVGSDRSIYDSCLNCLTASYAQGELGDDELRKLQQAPCVLNIAGRPCHPDEIVLQDSEWHVAFFGADIEPILCRPNPEHRILLEAIGVKRLSEISRVQLEYVEGPAVPEDAISNTLQQHSDIVLRLLHDRPLAVREKIRASISAMTAVSHSRVRIQASILLNGVELTAAPAPVKAHYDVDSKRLVVAQSVKDKLWPPVIAALFHQLMPEESGNEIARLNLNISLLMDMSVEDAHQQLSVVGVPETSPECFEQPATDLASPEIEKIGETTGYVDESDTPSANEPVAGRTIRAEGKSSQIDNGRPEISEIGAGTIGIENPADETANEPLAADGTDEEDVPKQNRGGGRTETNTDRDDGKARPSAPKPSSPTTDDDPRSILKQLMGTGAPEKPSPSKVHRPREKHKQQWDRRLLSYVRQKASSASGTSAGADTRDHNLEVEVLARDAVCRYERARGRDPEQLAQTHPGYDIVSRTTTGEERFIEVKGVNGEWNQTGVGLSRLQFSNAQEMGDQYWLYVVEYAGDPKNTRVHPIQSPALQVSSFMFDGNWRDVASNESADPALSFVVGAQIEHKGFGIGTIADVESKGVTRLLTIEFEKVGAKTLPLNLQTMSVLETVDGDDFS